MEIGTTNFSNDSPNEEIRHRKSMFVASNHVQTQDLSVSVDEQCKSRDCRYACTQLTSKFKWPPNGNNKIADTYATIPNGLA